MNKENISLPLSLSIAAIAVAFDNVIIKPIDYDPGLKHSIRFIKIGNWEKRIVKKFVKLITNDINIAIKKYKYKPIFLVYLLCNIKKGILFNFAETRYEIKENMKNEKS